MRVSAILVAAGAGLRFGAERPKQFHVFAGKPAVRWAAERLVRDVGLLQPVGDEVALAAALAGLDHLPVVTGGAHALLPRGAARHDRQMVEPGQRGR